MATASGTFEVVSGGEDVLAEPGNGVKLTHATGKQRFSGDIEGDGSVDWLMCYADGGARFVGLQRIDGNLGGQRGAFVVESTGDHDGKASKGSWRVVEGTGSGGLAGISGEGSFDAPGGPRVSYRLEYRLP